MNTTLALPKIASSADLQQQAEAIEKQLDRMAKENLQLNPAYSWPEKAAIIAMEKLRLAQDLTIVPTMVQMNVADEVERLWSARPGAYANLKEAVESETSMSYSEFHDLLALRREILPYLATQGVDTLEFFQSYKKSNIREMIPYLRSAISSQASDRDSVNQTLGRLRERVEDLPGVETEEDIRDAVVNEILSNAVGTNRMLRKALRPDSTPDLEIIFNEFSDGVVAGVFLFSKDQWIMLQRLLSKHADFIQMPTGTYEFKRMPAVRRLMEG